MRTVFYRRKILSALLKSFGGDCKKAQFTNLMFLFCQYKKENYYDFFPAPEGCYSNILIQDKNVMTSGKILKDSENFILNKKNAQYAKDLKKADEEYMERFMNEFKNLSETQITKLIKNKFPHYFLKPQKKSTKKILYTLGYEGISIDAYIDKLITNNIALVIDVRNNPLSMKYGFSKNQMKNYLTGAGISYIHIPELGIEKNIRKDFDSEKNYEELFDYFYKKILPNRKEYLERVIDLLDEYKSAALTCYEADYKHCHRYKVTAKMEKMPEFKAVVKHI
ncbi:MAG TPA: DUF488 domain-containing protein [Ignavibacteria bacterium]|nr:DUF488 domain-containing protein [Ignavibacteria bacterium]